MKLHLPKSLLLAFVAVMSASGATLTDLSKDATTGEIKVDKEGNQLYNVGSAVPGTKPHQNRTTYDDGDLTLDGKDRLGVYDPDGTFYSDSFGSIHGKASDWTAAYVDENYDFTSSGVVTNTFLINGTLTLEDKSQVNLGGQYRLSYGNNKGVYDEYTGLEATKVIVQDEAQLTATKARIGTLEIDGGVVNLRTGWTSGNGWVQGSGSDSKQAQILTKLLIKKGTLVMGSENASTSTSHWHQTFAGEIQQEGGTMTVEGQSIFAAGLSITQKEGSMSFCSKNGKLQLNGDASITQTSGTMTFAELYSTSTRKVTIKQDGAGTMDFLKGVTYKTKGDAASSITQSGSGTINLYGDFTSADFTVNQTNGTINLYGKMDLVGTDNSFGKNFDVESGAELTASSLSVGGMLTNDGTLTTSGKMTASGTVDNNKNMVVQDLEITGGTLTNDGTLTTSGKMTASGTVDNNKNMVVQALEITGGTTTNAEDATLTAGSITVNGGTFVNYGNITSANPSMLMTAEAEALAEANQVNLITIAQGVMMQYGTTDSNILVQNGGTLTLGVVDGRTVPTTVGAVTLEAGANMVVAGDSKTTGALTLEGGTITFMEGVELESTSVSGLDNVTITLNLSAETFADVVDGNGYAETLFTVAGTSALNGDTIFVATEGQAAQQVQVKQDAAGNVTVGQLVPEPTTATLSLLALAALAARRRRK